MINQSTSTTNTTGTHTQILNRSTQPIDNDSSDESDDDFDSFSPSFPSATASTSGLPPKTTRKSVTMGGVTKAGGGGGAGRGGEVRSGTPPSAMKGGRRGSQPQQPGLQRSVTDQQVGFVCGGGVICVVGGNF